MSCIICKDEDAKVCGYCESCYDGSVQSTERWKEEELISRIERLQQEKDKLLCRYLKLRKNGKAIMDEIEKKQCLITILRSTLTKDL